MYYHLKILLQRYITHVDGFEKQYSLSEILLRDQQKEKRLFHDYTTVAL